jgi:hypothetical protein
MIDEGMWLSTLIPKDGVVSKVSAFAGFFGGSVVSRIKFGAGRCRPFLTVGTEGGRHQERSPDYDG